MYDPLDFSASTTIALTKDSARASDSALASAVNAPNPRSHIVEMPPVERLGVGLKPDDAQVENRRH